MSDNEAKKTNPVLLILEKSEQILEKSEKIMESNRDAISNAEQLTKQLYNFEINIERLPKQVLTAHVKGADIQRSISQDIKNEIEKIPTILTDGIVSATEKIQENSQSQIKRFKTFFLLVGAVCIFSALTSLGVLKFAKNWYDTSVETKQEVKDELFQQFEQEEKLLVSEQEYIALVHEKELLKGWVKSNPDESKSYKTHRKAIMNLNNNKDMIFFKTPQSDEIKLGGDDSFFD